jgi:hypothetical protein
MMSFSITYWDSTKKFPYFADTTERGDRGWKQQGQGVKETMTLWISLLSDIVCQHTFGWIVYKPALVTLCFLTSQVLSAQGSRVIIEALHVGVVKIITGRLLLLKSLLRDGHYWPSRRKLKENPSSVFYDYIASSVLMKFLMYVLCCFVLFFSSKFHVGAFSWIIQTLMQDIYHTHIAGSSFMSKQIIIIIIGN